MIASPEIAIASSWRSFLNQYRTQHSVARVIGSGRLLLAAIGEDDVYSFSRAQSALVDGHDRSRPDNTASAVFLLRSRSDAAYLRSSGLLDDPMWRERALHTGDVAVGVASMTPPPKGSRRRNASLSVTCERLDSRLRVFGSGLLSPGGSVHRDGVRSSS